MRRQYAINYLESVAIFALLGELRASSSRMYYHNDIFVNIEDIFHKIDMSSAVECAGIARLDEQNTILRIVLFPFYHCCHISM